MVLRFAVFIDGLWFGGPSAPTDRFAETFQPGLPSHADTDASLDELAALIDTAGADEEHRAVERVLARADDGLMARYHFLHEKAVDELVESVQILKNKP